MKNIEKILQVFIKSKSKVLISSANSKINIEINGTQFPLNSKPLSEEEFNILKRSLQQYTSNRSNFEYENQNLKIEFNRDNLKITKEKSEKGDNLSKTVKINTQKIVNKDNTMSINFNPAKTKRINLDNMTSGKTIRFDSNTIKNADQELKINLKNNSDDKKENNESEITKLLIRLIKLNGKELYMCSGNHPFIRNNNHFFKLNQFAPITPAKLYSNLKLIIPKEYIKLFDKSKNFLFPYEIENVCKFRVNVFYDNIGICASFKKIPNKIPSLKILNLPQSIFNIIKKREGLVIINGQRRSGKSTTFTSIIQEINNNHNKYIITLENPIEFKHKSNFSLINQREVTQETFESTFYSSLLDNPDIIGFGEIKTEKDLSLAIKGVQEGNLIFAFLNTGSVTSAINFIENLYPESEKLKIRTILADNLCAIISQKTKIINEVTKYNSEVLMVSQNVSSLLKKGEKEEIKNFITV